MDRRMWCAMLAKLVAPMDAERAAAALVAMLPMLKGFPDGVFTEGSVHTVCTSGRAQADGSHGPLSRTPTYGELEAALGRLLRGLRESGALDGPKPLLALPAPVSGPSDAAMAEVARVVGAFVAQRTWNDPGVLEVERAKVKPLCPSDGVLLALYEKTARDTGSAAAMQRVRMLRAKIAAACTPPPPRPSAADLFADKL